MKIAASNSLMQLEGYDISKVPNKNYASMTDYANDLFAMEKKWQGQYSQIVGHSKVSSVEELKAEIKKLFPEYTMVSKKPTDVTNGQNQLYIDDANLEKMVKDPSYRTKVYALMKREVAPAGGFKINGEHCSMTGMAFTLSDDNPSEGGIPYLGMCTGYGPTPKLSCQNSKNKTYGMHLQKDKAKDKVKDRVKEKREDRKKEMKALWKKELLNSKAMVESAEEQEIPIDPSVAYKKAAALRMYEENAYYEK